MTATALLTDAYELSMVDTWVRDGGRHETPAVFEVFCRRLTQGHRYGVVAGTARVLKAVEDYRFEIQDLIKLGELLNLHDDTLNVLEDYRFTGEILGYPEGEIYFPNSPVLQVHGRLIDVLLETVVLSILNHDCAIAGKASRIREVAGDRKLIEMGSRRTHEAAAVHAARAAYIGGFDTTSNLAAGVEYGIPIAGTAAHAHTLAYAGESGISVGLTECRAFEAQIKARGADTTLLVDTYDVERGVTNATRVGLSNSGAVRIDSGDLAGSAKMCRSVLDSRGLQGTRIVATSDLDEYSIHKLLSDGAPIDGFGVGTKLVSAPPAGMVYKLVEVDKHPVAKLSPEKSDTGGVKYSYRRWVGTCVRSGERVTTHELPDETPIAVPLIPLSPQEAVQNAHVRRNWVVGSLSETLRTGGLLEALDGMG